ncbi:hypothetical protein [Methylobacterium sp. 1973]|uniref:hypothetical protein n=1 Tax=Methylobacterium sp. 1973 TaxID=3156421 RepID=UPI003399FA10
MKLVQLRIYSGDPETPGEAVYIAPDNVGMVEVGMADPPAAQVWLKVGTPMLLVEGSAETVTARVNTGFQPQPAHEGGTARVFGNPKMSPAVDYAELLDEIERFGDHGESGQLRILVSLLRDAVFHILTRLGPPRA